MSKYVRVQDKRISVTSRSDWRAVLKLWPDWGTLYGEGGTHVLSLVALSSPSLHGVSSIHKAIII